jgi:hypothetical protein
VKVCDLQDIGVRCYTFLATLRNFWMRAPRAASRWSWSPADSLPKVGTAR